MLTVSLIVILANIFELLENKAKAFFKGKPNFFYNVNKKNKYNNSKYVLKRKSANPPVIF